MSQMAYCYCPVHPELLPSVKSEELDWIFHSVIVLVSGAHLPNLL